MNILILTIGKWKNSPEKSLYEQYISRIPHSWKISLKEITIKERNNTNKQKQEEAEKLLEACNAFGAQNIIALDEKGTAISSEKLASTIDEYKNQGNNRLAFIIGGHAGLDPTIIEKADKTISFGAVTWPHLLMRALLAEQLYRCYTIIAKHPYHRS